MIRKREVTLVYIEETKVNGSPKKTEHTRLAPCDEVGQWSNSYYVDRNRDMRLSNNLEVAEHFVHDYEGGQLRYVEFEGKTYTVKNILLEKNKGDRFKILDIEEYKR